MTQIKGRTQQIDNKSMLKVQVKRNERHTQDSEGGHTARDTQSLLSSANLCRTQQIDPESLQNAHSLENELENELIL